MMCQIRHGLKGNEVGMGGEGRDDSRGVAPISTPKVYAINRQNGVRQMTIKQFEVSFRSVGGLYFGTLSGNI